MQGKGGGLQSSHKEGERRRVPEEEGESGREAVRERGQESAGREGKDLQLALVHALPWGAVKEWDEYLPAGRRGSEQARVRGVGGVARVMQGLSGR